MEYLCILCFILKLVYIRMFYFIKINVANIFENNNINYNLILIIFNY